MPHFWNLPSTGAQIQLVSAARANATEKYYGTNFPIHPCAEAETLVSMIAGSRCAQTAQDYF